MNIERNRILVADDEERIHDFFIEALKDAPEETGSEEFKQLEQQLFNAGAQPPAHSTRQAHLYELDLCTSGSDAVDYVIRSVEENKPYSVVFLDVRMPPGPDGIWAAEKIRTLDKDVEIVIVTAFSDIHPSEILKRVPPAHKLLYLQKPCYVLEIRHMAAALSSKWTMERELIRIQEKQQQHIKTQESALDEAYQTLERMQKLDALGMFAGGVAHDFNNIMTAIIGHTELALIDAEKDEGLHRRIEYINNACYRAKDLVNRILTFSRQTDPEFIPLSLGEVITDALKLIQSSIPGIISLETRIPDNVGLISADPTHVHQVMMNLCSNAVHAMHEKGGKLTITLGKLSDFSELREKSLTIGESDHVILCVADTGCGMSEETMEKMFDPYFTTKGKDEGTGLGLAVIHGIIKKQGGFIHAVSRQGEGTRFYVFFKRLSL